jgi:hypothetical protein
MPKLSNLQARRGASTIRIVAVAIVTIAAAYGSLWIVTKSFLDQVGIPRFTPLKSFILLQYNF